MNESVFIHFFSLFILLVLLILLINLYYRIYVFLIHLLIKHKEIVRIDRRNNTFDEEMH